MTKGDEKGTRRVSRVSAVNSWLLLESGIGGIKAENSTRTLIIRDEKRSWSILISHGGESSHFMPKKTVKFEDVLLGVEYVSSRGAYEHEAYLSLESGEIHYHSDLIDEPLPEDIDEAGKYISLPRKKELGLGNSLIFRFTEKFIPEASEKVRQVFSRPGAFARFKDLLQQRGLLKQWYDYEQKALEAALSEWCRSNRIETA